jgi:hypothetical protein
MHPLVAARYKRRRATHQELERKTCSVEAGAGFSKPTAQASSKPADVTSQYDQSLPVGSGMQKHGLTMFRLSCYSSLVPRVNPSLLYAAGSTEDCVDWGLGFCEMRFRDQFFISENIPR